jgi:large subunit ribosomal protein L13
MSEPAPIEIDARQRPLGRLASEVATHLTGKRSPQYERHRVSGSRVIVWNASIVALTGRKADRRLYRFSGYPGGLKSATLGSRLATQPERVIRDAVRRMLPKNRLQPDLLSRLTIHRGGKPS